MSSMNREQRIAKAIEALENGVFNEYVFGQATVRYDDMSPELLGRLELITDWFAACNAARKTRCESDLEFGFTTEHYDRMNAAWRALGGSSDLLNMMADN